MRSMHCISLHHGAAEKCWYGNYEQSVGSCEVSSRLDFVSAWLSSFHIGAGYTTDFLPCFTGWLGGLFRIQTYSNLFWHIQTIRGTCVLAYACHSLIPNVNSWCSFMAVHDFSLFPVSIQVLAKYQFSCGVFIMPSSLFFFPLNAATNQGALQRLGIVMDSDAG